MYCPRPTNHELQPSERIQAIHDLLRCVCESHNPVADVLTLGEVKVLLRALGRDTQGIIARDEVRMGDARGFMRLFDSAHASPSNHIERRRVAELVKLSVFGRGLPPVRYLHMRSMIDVGALLPENAGLDLVVGAGTMRRYSTPHGASCRSVVDDFTPLASLQRRASLNLTHSDERTPPTARPGMCSTIGRLPFGVSDKFPQQRWIRSRREKWQDTFETFDPERGRSGHRGGLGWAPADLGDEGAPGLGPPGSPVSGERGEEERESAHPTAFTRAPRRS